MMFVRLSVCLSGTGVHCDHMMHFSAADLSLRLDSPVFWPLGNLTTKHVHLSLLPTVFFQFRLEERWCLLGYVCATQKS